MKKIVLILVALSAGWASTASAHSFWGSITHAANSVASTVTHTANSGVQAVTHAANPIINHGIPTANHLYHNHVNYVMDPMYAQHAAQHRAEEHAAQAMHAAAHAAQQAAHLAKEKADVAALAVKDAAVVAYEFAKEHSSAGVALCEKAMPVFLRSAIGFGGTCPQTAATFFTECQLASTGGTVIGAAALAAVCTSINVQLIDNCTNTKGDTISEKVAKPLIAKGCSLLKLK
jgi:hypothetical protein